MDLQKKIENLPLVCGVYVMKSAAGEVLYIGKASLLQKRVKSHFLRNSSFKKEFFIENVKDIDYIECDTPEQALILEAALIQEKKPKYNIALRDNKSYPYIEITNEDFPRIFISRPRNKSKNTFFGPYPKVKTVKSALGLIRTIFPYRSCRIMPKSACLFYHLKLCQAPCIGNISTKQYRDSVVSICRILKGERSELSRYLKNQMAKLSANQNFEEAAKIRDRLSALEGIYKGKPKDHQIVSLKETLNLRHLPLIIEAIDISSLGPSDATGSVVVFRDGSADKNNYRRYRIKEVKAIDDYAMIAEVVRRRYSRLLAENRKLPDLVIIDGGKGHVQIARAELSKLKVFLPVIGIAKRNEEIWLPDKDTPLIIPKDSSSLHLIQRIRDEAHRFARKYHLILRRKKSGL
jgi:excinuclease ABC subunit C